MNIFLPSPFLHRGTIFLFPLSLDSTIYEVEQSCGLSSHGEFLGILRSFFLYFDLRDSIQRVTSVVQLARFNFYSRYRGF